MPTSSFSEPLNTFATHFTQLNLKGIADWLSEAHTFDGVSKAEYLALLEAHFESLRAHGIHRLKAYPGHCIGCMKGCTGFTFIDPKDGFYTDLVITIHKELVTDLTECNNFVNTQEHPHKTEYLYIKPFDNLSPDEEVPF